jgi:hypothetical protein
MNRQVLDILKEQGLNIIPLKERSKIPQLPWAKFQNEKFIGDIPDNVNIGVICGKISDNLVVIDIDINDESLVDEIFPDARNKTLVVKTGRGYHIYLKTDKLPNSLKLTKKKVGNVEIRSNGMYTVGPTSIHPETGKGYEKISLAINIARIADMEEILSRLNHIGFSKEQSVQSIKEIKKSGVPEGSRNDGMFKVACDLLDNLGLDTDAAWTYLLSINQKNNPPLPESELQCIFKSAIKTVRDKSSQVIKPVKKSTRNSTSFLKKIKGKVGNLYVESILIDETPFFLCKSLDDESLSLRESIETNDQIIRPLTKSECGYEPYSFTDLEIKNLMNTGISREMLLDEIKNYIDRFLSMSELDKHLVLGNIFLTYCQEWISTIHFPFFVGETESGKSTALHLARHLCYRCHLGEDIPIADVYNYLGPDEEGCGTIVEDEAQELWRNSEKLRMYKSSYAKGSKKARIVGVDTLGKHQVFYHTFCPKWFAGEKLPSDKGFLERIAVVHMMEGQPQSNIKKLSKDEVHQLHQLRNRLLVWKVQNISIELDKIDSGLKQRDQELWEDFLRVVNGTKYLDKCKEVAIHYTEQRHESIKNSPEARLFGLIVNKLDEKLELQFEEFWVYLVENNPEFPGKLDEKTGKTFYPEEFSATITPQSLSRIFQDKFQAVKKKTRARNGAKIQYQVTTYAFNKETIRKLAVKYGIDTSLDTFDV